MGQGSIMGKATNCDAKGRIPLYSLFSFGAKNQGKNLSEEWKQRMKNGKCEVKRFFQFSN